MKFIHLADLHIGKRVNGFSMLEDQRYILNQILQIVEEEEPQAVLIAGDVYDRNMPSEETVELLDDFLVKLSRKAVQVLMISGNHDSAERVAYGGRLLRASGIHLSPVYSGEILPVELEDGYGKINFWLIPFLKPAQVRRFFQNEEIKSYTDAMKKIVEGLEMDPSARNVALVHQFIAGGITSDSEEHSVGGTDEIAWETLDAFDYVALGHLHGPQKVGKSCIRYAGSPLKYSFSEVNQKKSVTIVELGEKGDSIIRQRPLVPKRDLVRIKGSFAEVMAQKEVTEDYCEITLTDEDDVVNALTRLRTLYPNVMVLRYDNKRTRNQDRILAMEDAENKTPLELFEELFRLQNGQDMTGEQKNLTQKLIEEIEEENR